MTKQNDNSILFQKREKTEKKLEDYKMEQLPLPFIFPKLEKNYSNTIELYDAIPKYFWGRIPTKNRIPA